MFVRAADKYVCEFNWKNESLQSIFNRLLNEIIELKSAINEKEDIDKRKKVKKESLKLTNIAKMIYNKVYL